jgi:hypothetical protein
MNRRTRKTIMLAPLLAFAGLTAGCGTAAATAHPAAAVASSPPQSAAPAATPSLSPSEFTDLSGQTCVAPDTSGYCPGDAPSPSASPSPAKPPPPPKPVIVARFSGSGIQNTPPFTVPDQWHLSWWYSCANFGMSGNFIVDEHNTDGGLDFNGASVNELGSGRGPVATYAYGDAGQHYLSVNSECDWQVVVVTG